MNHNALSLPRTGRNRKRGDIFRGICVATMVALGWSGESALPGEIAQSTGAGLTGNDAQSFGATVYAKGPDQATALFAFRLPANRPAVRWAHDTEDADGK